MTGPSFTDLRQRLAQDVPQGRCDEIGVRRLWWAALETLQQDLLERGLERGIWLAAPLPALYEPELLKHLQGWVWAPDQLDQLSPHPTALPGRSSSEDSGSLRGFQRLSLGPNDGDDPLLLVITPEVQVALALHGPPQKRQLLMRCDPATLSDVLVQLGGRLEHQSPAQAEQLRKALESIGSLQSNAAWSEQFWPRLTERLTGTAPGLMLQPIQAERPPEAPSHGDLNLLEAITHEVRTPLATIRTLIRSLLRRKDLADVVVNRLRQIDVECSEQIDRFGLIFHAAELQREPNEANLARTDLQAMLSALAPSWTEQLNRRGIALDPGRSRDGSVAPSSWVQGRSAWPANPCGPDWPRWAPVAVQRHGRSGQIDRSARCIPHRSAASDSQRHQPDPFAAAESGSVFGSWPAGCAPHG